MPTVNTPRWFGDATHWTAHAFTHAVQWLGSELAQFFFGLLSLLTDHWTWLDSVVYTDTYQQFVEIALAATLITSLATILAMLYYKIHRALDGGYFVREIGISLVIIPIFVFRFFNKTVPLRFLVLGYSLGYILLFGSAIFIILALIQEHRLSDKDIHKMLTEDEERTSREYYDKYA